MYYLWVNRLASDNNKEAQRKFRIFHFDRHFLVLMIFCLKFMYGVRSKFKVII